MSLVRGFNLPKESNEAPNLAWPDCFSSHLYVKFLRKLSLNDRYLLREGLNEKKRFLSGPLFSEVEIQDLKVSLELKILYFC